MKSWLLAAVIGFISAAVAIAPFFVFLYKGNNSKPEKAVAAIQFEPERMERKFEAGSEFTVRAIKVIDGYRFELYLEGNQWIEAHLPVAAKEEATAVVIDWFNKANPPAPTVILRRQVNSFWVVDLYLTVNGNRATVTEMLKAKGLLF